MILVKGFAMSGEDPPEHLSSGSGIGIGIGVLVGGLR